MNLVLLSGGSGQRLWPLSNDIRSKQFIKIFHREDGETWECSIHPDGPSYVVSGEFGGQELRDHFLRRRQHHFL